MNAQSMKTDKLKKKNRKASLNNVNVVLLDVISKRDNQDCFVFSHMRQLKRSGENRPANESVNNTIGVNKRLNHRLGSGL